ncbi:GNAT family N-acetyltransferase [Chryseobacterium taklimakanense]|uniref:GNAT family N-acetyltransferase n=1 Tax=Chryseobacterium taklimakanense TaxID=536441 RepID=A0A3G8WH43_9FLAO|nr:GNAT family N-acetyltransferase [Chryseobacterium taklimakanense]AZI20510.1 GNAT family N-acetyltransferase [Chryseobacterium taklimakanense]
MFFTIRKATENDIPTILHLITQLAIYEKLEHEVVATEETLKQTIFVQNYAEVIIGEEDGQPVGFALFFHNYSTFLSKPGIYLEDLFVEVEHRGKGYGKKLLAELARIAKERNCGRLEWSVLNWNTPSIEFYKSLGAKPMDEWTVYRMTEQEINDLAAL